MSIVNYLEKLPKTVEFTGEVQVAEQGFTARGRMVARARHVLRYMVRVGVAPSAEDRLLFLRQEGEELPDGRFLGLRVDQFDLGGMEIPVRPVRLGDSRTKSS